MTHSPSTFLIFTASPLRKFSLKTRGIIKKKKTSFYFLKEALALPFQKLLSKDNRKASCNTSPLLERGKTAASPMLLERRQAAEPSLCRCQESPLVIKQTNQPTQLRQELLPGTNSSGETFRRGPVL